jgi:hypothetical protein
MSKKLIYAALTALVAMALFFALRRPFPSNESPEGAYARIAKALAEGHPRDVFPYLETDAQWACISVHDARKAAKNRVAASYPASEQPTALAELGPLADSIDGEDVFVRTAEQRGWLARLKKDLSGGKGVEINGDRATVVTARGTRYSFRRRDNGMWGLTMFTAELVADRDKATRDLAVVNAAADDYDRAKSH